LAVADPLISEFLADNATTLVDEDGDYVDWIELHNPAPTTVDITGWYLTDSASDLTQWQFPSTIIPPNGYLIVFLSDKNRSEPGSSLHTNFKLDPPGEYLALVMDDGISVVDAFSPLYPPQYTDISYGISGTTYGYLEDATPGQPNSALLPPAPAFSVDDMFFATTLDIQLTTASPSGAIHYTLDGSEPTQSSSLYTSPITLVSTTVVKAAVYESAAQRSRTVTRHYVKLAANVQDFDSNLPLLLLDTFGAAPNQTVMTLGLASIIDTADGRSSPIDIPQFVGKGGIKIRGSSSTSFPKKQYLFETWDDNLLDKNVKLLHFPQDSDWIFYAPYSDKALMRNVLSYKWSNDIDRYASRTRFVEMFLNTDGGSLGSEDYVGVYVVMEKIKRGADRVDVTRLSLGDNIEPEITGGYIIKKDRLDPGDAGFVTSLGQRLGYVEPKEVDITAAQAAYLKGYIDSFESVLYSPEFTDPMAGYPAYIDVDSFIDHHILVEMTKNIDGFRLSTFWFKNRLGKLTMGPIWDYNLSLGNANYLEGWLPEGWYNELLSDSNYPWWRRLFEDPELSLRYADRWYKFRKDEFTTVKLHEDIDYYAALLDEAQERNFDRWPILGVYVWPNWFIANTYAEEISWMKQWLSDRLDWIDSQFSAPPIFNQDGGEVPSGFALTMSLPPNSTGTIYYTLDGTDPHLPAFDYTYLVPPEATKLAFVPSGDIGDTWRSDPAFDDSEWLYGSGSPGGVGFENTSGYEDYITTDVGVMQGQTGTCYIRIPFTLESDPDDIDLLFLQMQYDDGFVAFLNGIEVARANAPPILTWDSIATHAHNDAAAIHFEAFDVSAFLTELQPGYNLLAIHGLNNSVNSDDFLIAGNLVAASASTSCRGLIYTGPIELTDSVQVKARVLNVDEWSALAEATFLVDGYHVFINEIMYHPDLEEATEFVELYNTSETLALDLSGWRVDGVALSLPPETILPPSSYLVVVRDESAFQALYGTGLFVAAQYDGQLDNGGECLTLYNDAWAVVDSVCYDDDAPWPVPPDGGGPSLELVDVAQDNNRPANWAPSLTAGGSPGAPNSAVGTTDPVPELWVNELLSINTSVNVDEQGENDPWIEIYNASTDPINLDGMYLTNSYPLPGLWEIPAGVTVDALGWKLIWADAEPGDGPLHADFALSALGGSVGLYTSDGVIVDYLNYDALPPDVSYGKFPDGTPLRREFAAPTPESANEAGAVRVILNEYNAVASTSFLDNAGTDVFWGRVAGNGGDWFELVVTDDHVDMRGWELVVSNDTGGTGETVQSLFLTDAAIWSDVRAGTIITIAEDLADNVSYDPGHNDWWINVQAADIGSGAYIANTDFTVSNVYWQLTIRDSAGHLVFGPAGEGVEPTSGIGSEEVFKLEEDPSAFIHPHSNFNDGSSSTFGAPNLYAAGTAEQDFTALRLAFEPCTYDDDCDDWNTCTSDTCDTFHGCVYLDVTDGTLCPDGDFCNGEETCQSGFCAAGPDPCAGPCTQCDEELDMCVWCIYDIDQNGWIASGDFGAFAGCYGQCYPAGDPCLAANFDGSPDGCVGSGDFGAFAGCYGSQCSDCASCFGTP
jgi:hypothetical protein